MPEQIWHVVRIKLACKVLMQIDKLQSAMTHNYSKCVLDMSITVSHHIINCKQLKTRLRSFRRQIYHNSSWCFCLLRCFCAVKLLQKLSKSLSVNKAKASIAMNKMNSCMLQSKLLLSITCGCVPVSLKTNSYFLMLNHNLVVRRRHWRRPNCSDYQLYQTTPSSRLP